MHSAGTAHVALFPGDVFARIPVEMCYKLDAAVEFLPVWTNIRQNPARLRQKTKDC